MSLSMLDMDYEYVVHLRYSDFCSVLHETVSNPVIKCYKGESQMELSLN